MDTKDKLNIPPFDWDKWLPRIAFFIVVSFVLALILRIRTILVAIEIIDIGLIVGLILIWAYGMLRRYSSPSEPRK